MRFFYVDYENVMDSGLNGIAKLTSSDTVKIFYSEDAQRLSFGTHRRCDCFSGRISGRI